jgi:hypothetical protein
LSIEIPEMIVVGESGLIKLHYDLDTIKSINTRNGQTILIDSIPASNYISFQILEINNEMDEKLDLKQLGTSFQYTNFSVNPTWDVKFSALKAGRTTIGVKPTIRIQCEDKTSLEDIDLPIKTFELDIKSKIGFSIRMFFYKYWQWIITTIIIPVWTYFFIQIRKAKKQNEVSQVEIKDFNNNKT